ncbi:ABC2 type transporter superfamily protein [Pelomyxa schiedti]|nr:ABC2 type transporter superfamily protein [Pelomyxa schiedti]
MSGSADIEMQRVADPDDERGAVAVSIATASSPSLRHGSTASSSSVGIVVSAVPTSHAHVHRHEHRRHGHGHGHEHEHGRDGHGRGHRHRHASDYDDRSTSSSSSSSSDEEDHTRANCGMDSATTTGGVVGEDISKGELGETGSLDVVPIGTGGIGMAPSVVVRGLSYTVKLKPKIKCTGRKTACCFGRENKRILNNINLVFRPGTLTALMGPSGAGKTTLLNCLSGRGTGTLNGEILFSQSASNYTFIIQQDTMPETLTSRENIDFAAQLLLPPTSKASRYELVTSIIDQLHIQKCADTVVGTPGVKAAISGGERKRVAIGMSLVNNPAVLLVDEPTSGLDSTAALNVISILRQLADSGRTVICCIHQPSHAIFHLFTHVCLLAEGNIIYYGERKNAVPHFKSLGCVPPRHVPASAWMLDLVDTQADLRSNDHSAVDDLDASKLNNGTGLKPHTSEFVNHLATAYSASEGAASTTKEAQTDSSDLIEQRKLKHSYARAHPSQCKILINRNLCSLRREKVFLRTRMAQTVAVAILMFAIYWQMDNSQAGIRNRMGMLFFSSMIMLLFGMLSVLFVLPKEYAVLLRESLNNMYSPAVFLQSKIITDTPLQIIFPLIFSLLVYFTCGLNLSVDKFFIFTAVMVLISNTGSSIGFLVSSIIKDAAGAMQIAPALFIPNVVFSGFVVDLDSVPTFLAWIQWLSFLKYGYAILVKNEMAGQTFYCNPDELINGQCPLTSGDDVLKYYNLDGANPLIYFFVLLGTVVLIRMISIVVLVFKVSRYQKK